MDSQTRNALLAAVLGVTVALSALQTVVISRNQRAAAATLKESVYALTAAQARNQLQMLRLLEARDSSSAQQLSVLLLRSAESALADYAPPEDSTEASRFIVAVKQQLAEYQRR
jgi:hypothetical protein